jgi:sugar phosphate permease
MNIFYGWWVVAACFGIAFYVSGTVAFGFTAFFEPIAEEFGWSYTQISFAASLRGLEMGIFAPLLGFLVDRFGARRLLFAGTISVGLGLILLGRIQTLGMFYGAFVVVGLGTSACTATVMTPAVGNWFKKDIGKALGIMNIGIGCGGILLPLIAVLIDHYQWRGAITILGIGTLLIGMPLSLVVRQRPEQYGYLPDGAKATAPHSPGELPDLEVNLRAALRTRVFWHLSIAEALRLMTLTALITHIIPYLSSVGISRAQATAVAAAIPLLSIGARLLFGWLGDRYNKFHIMALLYFLGGVSILIFAYVDREWLLVPFLILFPLSWGAPPLQGAILRECFGRLSLGSILGILGGLITVARIFGPSLAGWTYDTFGRYHSVWLFFAGTFGVAVVLMLTVRPLKN